MSNHWEEPHSPGVMPLNGRKTVCAVVPCYNAGNRLRSVIQGLLVLVDRVIVVDDGSTDNALDQLQGLSILTVVFPVNQGKGHALLAGFSAALQFPEVECVVVVDSDGQHDPRELPGLYACMLKEQADLVIGSRTFGQAQVPLHNALGNRFTSILTSALLGRRVPDTQSGYRLHSRRFVESIVQSLSGGRYETEMEILVKAAYGEYKIASSPIQTIYEAGNASSHFNKIRDSWRILRTLFRAVRHYRGHVDRSD